MTLFNKKSSFLAHHILIASWLLAGCVGTYQTNISAPKVSHTAVLVSRVDLLWSIDNIYSIHDRFASQISASGNLVCVLGDVTTALINGVSCFNSVSHELVWQKRGAAIAITVLPDSVLVTYVPEGVYKYDTSGNYIWSRFQAGGHYAYVYKDQIQLSGPQHFQVLSLADGSVLEQINDEGIIYSTATRRYVDNYDLEARSTDMSQLFWSAESGQEIIQVPLFLNDHIFFRSGDRMGRVYALSQSNGQMLWQTEANIVSNIVHLARDGKVVVLTEDGKLLSLNVQNGTQETLAEFTNVPFVFYANGTVGGYELAYDEASRTLFVLLGDSRQLFAFRVK